MNWIDLAQDRDQWWALEKSNELLSAIKSWEILEQLSNEWLL
jgi:hypothetical protein